MLNEKKDVSRIKAFRPSWIDLKYCLAVSINEFKGRVIKPIKTYGKKGISFKIGPSIYGPTKIIIPPNNV